MVTKVGIVAALIIIISYSIVLRWGAIERVEFLKDSETAPSYREALKYTFQNKAFRYFVIAALATWICNGILPIVIPLFATYVLHIAEEDSILIGVLLLTGFLVGAISMPFWIKIRQKKRSTSYWHDCFCLLGYWALILYVVF